MIQTTLERLTKSFIDSKIVGYEPDTEYNSD